MEFPKESLQTVLFIYFVGINSLLFILMGIDKCCAIIKKWRISEKTLLLLGILGGGFGGILGLFIFNHKKRKNYFLITFLVNIFFWLVIGVVWMYRK